MHRRAGLSAGLSRFMGHEQCVGCQLWQHAPTSKAGAVCGNSARTDLRGGRAAMSVPTATVADLDEDYIADMEDTLETYERPYDPQQPVVCLDEKPVTLHALLRRSTGTRSAPG